MDDKTEVNLRRKAIRLSLRGLRPQAVLEKVKRCRSWLCKWQQRFARFGWTGLKSESRRPQHAPQRYDRRVRVLVLRLRRQLQQRKVGLIGAQAIRRELRQARLLRKIPSTATIDRWLKAAGLVKAAPAAKPAAYYPQPTATERYVLHACDWTARYLTGGEKVFAFHTIDVQTRAITQTISTDKNSATVRRHALQTWQTLGLPDALQMDNDAAFCGGYKVQRIFGQFVRLCLYLGIEPIFIPVGEPNRNGLVERLNGLWSQSFFKRRRFRSVAHVTRSGPEFEDWYATRYEPPALFGKSPAQIHLQVVRQRLTGRQIRALPEELPITAGRVHFIRRVSSTGEIALLNETWPVGRRLAHQYVWATVSTHEQRLEIYHRRTSQARVRRVKTFKYQLPERVRPLCAEFKRLYSRRRMFTML
jgi:putative transposase